jgi:hypothetical protein
MPIIFSIHNYRHCFPSDCFTAHTTQKKHLPPQRFGVNKKQHQQQHRQGQPQRQRQNNKSAKENTNNRYNDDTINQQRKIPTEATTMLMTMTNGFLLAFRINFPLWEKPLFLQIQGHHHHLNCFWDLILSCLKITILIGKRVQLTLGTHLRDGRHQVQRRQLHLMFAIGIEQTTTWWQYGGMAI